MLRLESWPPNKSRQIAVRKRGKEERKIEGQKENGSEQKAITSPQ